MEAVWPCGQGVALLCLLCLIGSVFVSFRSVNCECRCGSVILSVALVDFAHIFLFELTLKSCGLS